MRYHARVRDGRITLDEPTDLPDGTEVELVTESELTPEEYAALREGFAQYRAGEGISATEMVAQLRDGLPRTNR